MRSVSRAEWLGALKKGDIGLNLSNNPFAKLQRLYHKKFGNGEDYASHGFLLTDPPYIIEANGIFITKATIGKFVGNTTKAWIFRSTKATPEQVDLMLAYAEGAKRSGGHYSVGGIVQFGLQYLGIRKKISDEAGVFCTELTGQAIRRARLPYIEKGAHTVTPSEQLNYMLYNPQDWKLALHYDGNGTYLVE